MFLLLRFRGNFDSVGCHASRSVGNLVDLASGQDIAEVRAAGLQENIRGAVKLKEKLVDESAF